MVRGKAVAGVAGVAGVAAAAAAAAAGNLNMDSKECDATRTRTAGLLTLHVPPLVSS